MTVFVRTQDKAKILSVDCIYYDEKKTTKKIPQSENVIVETTVLTHRLVCCNRTLGEYESKERCLAIMDDIQNAINTQGKNATLVYSMPIN